MTSAIPITCEKPPSTVQPLDKGVAALAMTCGGLFKGRTGRTARIVPISTKNREPLKRIGNQPAA